MFQIRPLIIFITNIAFMLISWGIHEYSRGDEYLVLFMIPLIFMVAPFALTAPLMSVLFVINFVFLIIYNVIGILDMNDTVVFVILFGASGICGYLTRSLHEAFISYHKSDILGRQRAYNSMVNTLEAVDRRGRKVESELTQISHLYEITKKLAPALKFEDLLNTLFSFLEDNFRFQTTHLITFSKGKFARGISKSVGDEKYSENSEKVLEYEKVIDYVKKQDFKPFFIQQEDAKDLFDMMKVSSGTFMVFPLFIGSDLSAILAIEGVSRSSYGRFRILVPQIMLELRRVELYEKVQELSIIDGLTEVYLRRYMIGRMREEVDRASRLGLTFSIGMVDVDYFKQCNDKYGHLVGDAVLKKIADRLKGSVREVDMVARYGGEEFCIMLPDTSKKLAMAVSERLRKSIAEKPIKAFDEEIKVTVSVGIATYPENGQNADFLIEKADTALYKAKRNGRNRVCVI